MLAASPGRSLPMQRTVGLRPGRPASSYTKRVAAHQICTLASSSDGCPRGVWAGVGAASRSSAAANRHIFINDAIETEKYAFKRIFYDFVG